MQIIKFPITILIYRTNLHILHLGLRKLCKFFVSVSDVWGVYISESLFLLYLSKSSLLIPPVPSLLSEQITRFVYHFLLLEISSQTLFCRLVLEALFSHDLIHLLFHFQSLRHHRLILIQPEKIDFMGIISERSLGEGADKYMWLHGSRIVFVSCALTLRNTSSWPYIWSAYSFKILYASRIVSRSLLLQKSRKPLSPGHIANFRFLDCGWCHFPFDFLFFTFVSDILKTSNERFYHNCWRGLYYYIWFKAKQRSN